MLLLVGLILGLVGMAVQWWRGQSREEEEEHPEVRRKKILMKKTTKQKQKVARKWTVLDLGLKLPDDFQEVYRLEILLEDEDEKKVFSLPQLRQLVSEQVRENDWVCVTGWTFPNNRLYGIPLSELVPNFREFKFCVQTSADGYKTSVYTADLEGSFIALSQEDDSGARVDLSHEHGVVRLVIPELFGWKSAKYLAKLQFTNSYEQGFWEKLGCHERGRVKYEERWKKGVSTTIWKGLIYLHSLYDFCGQEMWTKSMKMGSTVLGYIVRKLT
jgi:DMSO/TMAO reductase YedYZ molybdopterin-dependent catalytic subunit